jgi:peptidoglycan-associated lipoprotein
MSRHRSILLFLGAAALAVACGPKRAPVLTNAPGGEMGPGTEAAPRPSASLDPGPDVGGVRDDGVTSGDFPSSENLGEGGPLTDIHFELDRASLSDEARSTLEKHAVWLQANRNMKVTVEGHCDERGTVEYNLALGEQRAQSARDYLATLGVSSSRMRTVSYGKERPLAAGTDEQSFSKNRRAHFAVGT